MAQSVFVELLPNLVLQFSKYRNYAFSDWNGLLLNIASRVMGFNQSEIIISQLSNYAILKFLHKV